MTDAGDIGSRDDALLAASGRRLFDFQKVGVAALMARRRFLLADDMGTGKTMQVLVALGPASGARALVVTTKSGRVVWAAEAALCRPDLRVRTDESAWTAAWPEQGELRVVSYERLPRLHADGCEGLLPAKPCTGCAEKLVSVGSSVVVVRAGHLESCDGLSKGRRRPCPGCHPMLAACPENVTLVLDEAHRAKNRNSLRTRRCAALSRAARRRPGGGCWLLSGTPMENDPLELWTVLEVAGLANECFGSLANVFRLFDAKPRMFGRTRRGWVWGQPLPEVRERLARVMLRRRKIDVLPQLPPKMWRTLTVEIDRETIARCDAYLRAAGGIKNVVAMMLAKDKVGFEDMAEVRVALATAKIPAIVDYLDDLQDAHEPIVVFSVHRAPVEFLGTRPGWATLHGGTPEAERRSNVERFQRGELRGIALTMQAGGESITLTRASQVLIVDPPYKPSMLDQAVDRVYRIGQTRGVLVTSLDADHPLDRRVNAILRDKRERNAATLDPPPERTSLALH
jgi:SWI/SNF-related matrix-associated actin-dependent regulator 1 of chromatin subfamily A